MPEGLQVLIAGALYAVVQEYFPCPDDEKKDTTMTTVTGEREMEKGPLLRQEKDNDKLFDQADHPYHFDSSFNGKRSNLTNLFKPYTGDYEKYSGVTKETFDRKYVLFLERCDQSDVTTDDHARAFSIMLTLNARQYYLDVLRSKNLSLDDLAKSMKDRFCTFELRLALLREWDSLSLNIKKILISKVSDIQISLQNEYRSVTISRDKLLNALRDVSDCRFAYHNRLILFRCHIRSTCVSCN